MMSIYINLNATALTAVVTTSRLRQKCQDQVLTHEVFISEQGAFCWVYNTAAWETQSTGRGSTMLTSERCS